MKILTIGEHEVFIDVENAMDITELQEQIDELLVIINMIPELNQTLNRTQSFASKDQMEIIRLTADSIEIDAKFDVAFVISKDGILTSIRFSGNLLGIDVEYGYGISEKIYPYPITSFPLQIMKLLLMKM